VDEIRIKTPERMALIDVTGEVNSVVEKSGVRDGLCNLFVPHTTAAVIVSENWDPDVNLGPVAATRTHRAPGSWL
jgi:secondary thiamine-phosphate synthase enzyme